MPNWVELESRFRELERSEHGARVDYTDGSTGREFLVVGYLDTNWKNEFLAVSRMAGAKVDQSTLSRCGIPETALVGDEVDRWLSILWYKGDHLQNALHGWESDQHGNPIPGTSTYYGSILNPSQLSKTLCVEFLSLEERPKRDYISLTIQRFRTNKFGAIITILFIAVAAIVGFSDNIQSILNNFRDFIEVDVINTNSKENSTREIDNSN